MNLDQAPIPNGVEAPFILITKPNDCECDYCRSSNTYLNLDGINYKYYFCKECKLPFSKFKK